MAILQKNFSLMKVMASPARRKDIGMGCFEEKYGCYHE